jgi:hypothetical protein
LCFNPLIIQVDFEVPEGNYSDPTIEEEEEELDPMDWESTTQSVFAFGDVEPAAAAAALVGGILSSYLGEEFETKQQQQKPKRSVHFNEQVRIREVEIMDQPYNGWVRFRYNEEEEWLENIFGIGLSNNYRDTVDNMDSLLQKHRRYFSWGNHITESIDNNEPVLVTWPKCKTSLIISL